MSTKQMTLTGLAPSTVPSTSQLPIHSAIPTSRTYLMHVRTLIEHLRQQRLGGREEVGELESINQKLQYSSYSLLGYKLQTTDYKPEVVVCSLI